jgi:hypothetical protein
LFKLEILNKKLYDALVKNGYVQTETNKTLGVYVFEKPQN